MTAATAVADAVARERAVARLVTAVATLAFAAAALADAAAPIGAGHYASTASVGIVADNMLRWHVPWPVWSYTEGPPTAALAYGHHPWGIFWTTAGVFALVGRSDLACRVAPIVLSTATIPLLHAIGARLHRPLAGALGAATFAALPISLAFASFNALEVPVIAWSALSLWGFVGLWSEAPRRRDALAWCSGALLAAECDWPGFLTGGLLAAGGLVALVVRPPARVGRAGRMRRDALLAGALLLALALVVQIVWLQRIGKLDDLFHSYDVRSAGRGAPLLRVLAARRYWLELCFTKVGLALAATGPVLLALSAWRRRRAIQLAPLALGATATIQYVVFRQGADVHVFWPQHFTPFIALATAAWVATACDVAPPRMRALSVWGASGLTLALVLWIARDGAAAWRYARSTGGRFDEKGLLIHSDGDVLAGMRRIVPSLSPDGVVELDGGLKPTWSQAWSIARPIEPRAGFPDEACASQRGAGSPAAWMADVRFVPAPLLREIVARCSVQVLGPLLVVEPEPRRALRAWSLETTETTTLERWLRATTEPVRVAEPDPFGAWELRLHLDAPGALAGKAPPATPERIDELRIAWSLAHERGDREAADRLWARLAPHVRPVDASFEDGTRIVGVVDAARAGEAMRVLVEAAGPLERGVEASVVGVVVEPLPWSLTMPDPHRREMAMPPRIPPTLWRAGWLYPIEVFVHPRPGREVLRASLRARGAGRAPRLVSGDADVVIAEVTSR